MKSFEIHEFGIEKLSLAEVQSPSPGPFEVLVRLRAASLNYRDYMVVTGSYNPNLKRPTVPLSDGAGLIEEVGPHVTRWKKGDRVAGIFMQKWLEGPITQEKYKSALGGAIDGVARESMLFHEDGLVRVPGFLSDEEAAALPCAAVTAWHALFEYAPTVPGESVLLLGTGGVSVFALQFAKVAGLRVLVTSGSDEKLARARELGADETINYKRHPEWQEEARRLTAGVGVDHVVEVGGTGTAPKSLRAVRMGGRVSIIGGLTGAREAGISPASLLMNSIDGQGIYVGSRSMFERMNRAIELHKIKPVIDRTFPFTELPDALRHLESQAHFGKLCLRF